MVGFLDRSEYLNCPLEDDIELISEVPEVEDKVLVFHLLEFKVVYNVFTCNVIFFKEFNVILGCQTEQLGQTWGKQAVISLLMTAVWMISFAFF